MILLHAIEGVLTLLLMGLVGYMSARKGWFTDDAKAALPKLITYVSLPLFLLCNLTSTFKRDELVHLAYGAIVPMLAMLICWGISLVLGRLLRIDKKHIGLFHTSFITSNSIFVGIPVNIALFGDASLPYTLLYFFANTIFFWTVGNYYISADASAGTVKIFSKATWKKIFSMPIIGFIAAVTLIMLDLQLPDFLLNTARYLGNITTPLAIILIGVILHGIDLKKTRLSKDILWVMVGRFIVSPLSILLVVYFIPVPDLMRKVFIMQASLPAMVQTVVLSSFYKTDTEYATLIVSVTTLASIVTIPILMMLIS